MLRNILSVIFLFTAVHLSGVEDPVAWWSAESNQADAWLGHSVRSGDFNGDGYDDLLAGAAHNYWSWGKVYVWYGSAAGLGPAGDPTNADWTGEGLQADACFGRSVASGDFDGDGYDDALIAANRYVSPTIGEGMLFVWYGSASGLGPDGTPANADWRAESNHGDGYLGCSVASGDFNGDGYDDVLAGAWGYNNPLNDEGMAFVWYGSATGLGPDGNPVNADWKCESDQAEARLGGSVNSGDFDGDTYDDVIVGSEMYDNGQSDEGMVFVWYGSASGLGPDGTPANADWQAESNQATAYLGNTVASGDFNGDTYYDVLAGADIYDNPESNEGMVFVWYGSSAGLGPDGDPTNADWKAESDQVSAWFGCSIGSGDFNGDTYDEVLAGASGYDNPESNEGMIFVWYGSSAGLGPDGNPANADWQAESNQVSGGLGGWYPAGGASVSSGDFDDDGYDEIMGGAEYYDNPESAEGMVFVWKYEPPVGTGDVWGWGFNAYGQLGDNSTTNRSTPVDMHNLANIVSIDGGCDYSLAAKLDGTVWAVGRNNYGQLGDNTTNDHLEPIQTHILTNVITVAAGYYHALALKSDSTVWAWGSNSQGQVGDNSTTNRWEPVQTHNIINITAIDAGIWHSLALRSDSTVWAWGRNNEGELGNNTTTNSLEPCSTWISSDVIAIAAGAIHSLAIKSDKTVWAWGRNNWGQLGDNTTIERHTPVQTNILTDVIAVDGGDGHSLALKSNGTVWAWGRNNRGQLGINSTAEEHEPCSTYIDNVVAIAAGALFSMALKSDGTVWAWGANNDGQLGDNTIIDRHIPVQVHGGEQGGSYLTDINVFNAGGFHSLAVEDAPLAVELMNFDALATSCSIQLQWSSASSNATFQYIIRRSVAKDNDYSDIVRIPGSGLSPSTKTYSYTDKDVKSGVTYYYKLGIVRTNGNTEWYGPVSAMVIGTKPFLRVSPNPFRDRVEIRYSIGQSAEGNTSAQGHKSTGAQVKNIELNIYDMSGRLVKDFSLGTNHYPLITGVTWNGRDNSGKKVPSGIYFLKFQAGGYIETKKIILFR